MARNDSGLFYPGVTELEKATRIAVQPGDEAGPIDFTLTRREVGNVSSASLRRIRVQLIDETTGAASTRATAVVEEQNSKGGYNEGGAYQSSNGQIQTRILAPGTYRITATAPEGAGNPGSRGSTIVTLGDSDVDVVLTLASLPKIDGRLQAEGVLSASNMRNLRIALSPAPPDQSSIRQPFAEGGSLKADGTFTLSGATAGVYRVKISGLPAGFFVKHARFDGADVLNSAVSFSRSGQLDILISEKSGRLDGVALNNQGQPFERAAVVLVPDAARNRPELFRSAVTDAAGRFTISGVVPGRYKVSALEAMEPNAYFDPDFIAQFDLVGRPVEIAESARESVELMVIPWGNAP
jgi:hypothetical protein